MTRCAWTEGETHCALPTVGKSKYCAKHRGIAKDLWLAKVRKSAEEREGRAQEAEMILLEAESAAKERERIKLDRLAAVVTVSPANTSFACHAKRLDGWTSKPGRIQKVVGNGREAMAYAQGYTQTLKRYGLEARAYLILEE
jgi:hypothetical protein